MYDIGKKYVEFQTQRHVARCPMTKASSAEDKNLEFLN